MTTCDFTQYNQLRDATATKATAAQEKCVALEEATAARIAAEEAEAQAQSDKVTAYTEWEQAEQAENAAAAELGINPVPPGA